MQGRGADTNSAAISEIFVGDAAPAFPIQRRVADLEVGAGYVISDIASANSQSTSPWRACILPALTPMRMPIIEFGIGAVSTGKLWKGAYSGENPPLGLQASPLSSSSAPTAAMKWPAMWGGDH